MKIGELAEQTGLAPSAIRYYEHSGLLPKATRGANGYRVYAETAVERLRLIQMAQNLGFSLDSLRNVFASGEDFSKEDLLAGLDRRMSEIEQLMRTLRNQQQELRALRSTLSETWAQGECFKAADLGNGKLAKSRQAS
ncbi:MerR family transcriptional regulator [Collimonas sp. NPDC087041]|uniref:MerR family transcriptional regulator n=1 Tax=Collimonas sp. NPDC087041 TaxID=3363960 RepID=UPI0038267F5F